jgi:hypothetical protein
MSLREANDFVQSFHRHSGRTSRDGGKFAIGCVDDLGELLGVAIVGRPLARMLDDGMTAEVTRTCVRPDAPKNVNSFLYGRCWRIWQQMGGTRMVTYTLESESGASLRGAGWKIAGVSKGHKDGWARSDSPHIKRTWQPLFGQQKFRWEAT